MDDEGSLGIAARLAIGVVVAIVLNIVGVETLGPAVLVGTFALTALVVAWVVAGAARDDGGARKAGPWALFGIGVASACITLFCVFGTMAIYVILVHPPGP